jgi:hypothetical protein
MLVSRDHVAGQDSHARERDLVGDDRARRRPLHRGHLTDRTELIR